MVDKVALWEELTSIKSSYQDKVWGLCGDFNAVRSEGERKGIRGGSSKKSEIIGFNSFIERNLLFEIPIVGKKYTWYKANGSAKSRLDRIFVSEEWLQKWPECKQYVQPRVVSDHCAIVVKSVLKDWGPSPFRTIDAWQMEPGFKEMVKEKWCSYTVQGNSLTKIKDKLKILKADLRVWNREVFGCLNTNRKRLLKEIEDLDVQDNVLDLDECDKRLRMELISHLREVDKKLESLSRQKARANWAKYGDINSKYFHSVIRWRRMRNSVKGVMVGSTWCEDPLVVRREAKSLF
ncbi:uncharacterized protein [Phaseolus vulgaris]|uniref:uncharacterized protein n=1 Tax=Phaseolus vulgaris TaxID=3885 RepID=UPI0035CB1B9E